jgi:uncharacterized membrane protein
MRYTAGKLAGWLAIIAGVLFVVADFIASDHTFAAVPHALHESFGWFILGLLLLAHAGSTERIVQLERENAALRAARGEPSSRPEKT